jgi:hypothetical protein
MMSSQSSNKLTKNSKERHLLKKKSESKSKISIKTSKTQKEIAKSKPKPSQALEDSQSKTSRTALVIT